MKKDKKVEMIMAYESGELKAEDTLKLFAELVRTGEAFTLQGHYGRVAQGLIDEGYLDKNGNILKQLGD